MEEGVNLNLSAPRSQDEVRTSQHDTAGPPPMTSHHRNSDFASTDTTTQAVDITYKAAEDADTCRICRAEGTFEEPLFYPCRCSGSIKFVHQTCLEEWLSHSNKRHCELCKRTFQFTKMYDPQMPRILPLGIFARQILVHIGRAGNIAIRWLLVAFVWLVWLPWIMRTVWRALFYVAEGGWYRPEDRTAASLLNDTVAAETPPGIRSNTTYLDLFTRIWERLTIRLSHLGLNSTSVVTSATPAGLDILSLFLGGIGRLIDPQAFVAINSPALAALFHEIHPRPSSLLSDISFFNNLTRFRLVNNIILDIVEGQIITVLIVATVIIIFLIREWVVQQQLPLNRMGAPFDQAVEPVARQDQANGHEDVEGEPADGEPSENAEVDHADPLEKESDPEKDHEHEDTDISSEDAAASAPERPKMPSKEVLARISDIHRFLEELRLDKGEHKEALTILDELYQSSLNGNVELMMSSLEKLRLEKQTPDLDLAIQRAGQVLQSAYDYGKLLSVLKGEENPYSIGLANQSEASQIRPVPDLENASTNVSASIIAADDFDSELEDPSSISTTPVHNALDEQETRQDARQNPQIPSWIDRISNLLFGSLNDPAPAAPSQPNVVAEVGAGVDHSDNAHSELAHATAQDEVQVALPENAPARPATPIGRNELVEDVREPERPRIQNEELLFDDELDQMDAEDFENILDLIGAQGPLIGLLQNAAFSLFVIIISIVFGIWLPYIAGKLTLVLLAHPIEMLIKVPILSVSIVADLLFDALIFMGGCAFYCTDWLIRALVAPVGWVIPVIGRMNADPVLSQTASKYAWNSAERLADIFLSISDTFTDGGIPTLSMVAHESLNQHKANVKAVLMLFFNAIRAIFSISPSRSATTLSSSIATAYGNFRSGFAQVLLSFDAIEQLLPRRWLVALTKVRTSSAVRESLDTTLAAWNVQDRILATLIGFTALAFTAAVYLELRKLFRNSDKSDSLVESALSQASGVIKVILIISIEMIVFPLYCGILLDFALLPLFEGATVNTRCTFAILNPLTAVFVHWFAGTCYMFHFALFVSMCRKIMRPGVLYFIRDPDDPTFHPVRDVLERNVWTQLKKIAFSGLVYGGLVIVCLGAVVWSLEACTTSIFPLHWSSSVPILQFPLDLSVYNFLMPIAVRSFRPFDGLHVMYRWWFKASARFLRLSSFLIGERRFEEEFRSVPKGTNANGRTWNETIRLLIEENQKENDRFRKHTLTKYKKSAQTYALSHDIRHSAFIFEGKFVRAPGSDTVRIPKDAQVFLEVDRFNNRSDGKAEEDGRTALHSPNNPSFARVYIPPSFQTRVVAFTVTLWLFAAITGLGSTLLPLIFGRYLLARLVPSDLPMNDMYAAAVGVCLLGVPLHYIIHYRKQIFGLLPAVKARLSRGIPVTRFPLYLKRVASSIQQFVTVVYFYGAFIVVIPALFALANEAYVIIPLQEMIAYISGTRPGQHANVTIYFLQDWTLALLFTKLIGNIILRYENSRPARALRATVSDVDHGATWTRPNIRLATRAFIFPTILVMAVALLLPLGLSHGILLVFRMANVNVPTAGSILIYRLGYPAVLAVALAIALQRLLARVFSTWRTKIRDEVYLVGERLHNFNDKRLSGAGKNKASMAKAFQHNGVGAGMN